jgi:type I restriction enzyme R subunit
MILAECGDEPEIAEARRSASGLELNGVMEPAWLYEPPFTDLAPHGPESLFPAADVDRVTVLRRVQETAEPSAVAA